MVDTLYATENCTSFPTSNFRKYSLEANAYGYTLADEEQILYLIAFTFHTRCRDVSEGQNSLVGRFPICSWFSNKDNCIPGEYCAILDTNFGKEKEIPDLTFACNCWGMMNIEEWRKVD